MGRDLGLERAWRDRMGRYERSGLTIQGFCEQEGLVAHQFSWWRRELKRRSQEAGPAHKTKTAPARKRTKRGKGTNRGRRNREPAKFVPVQVTDSVRTRGPIEIVLDQPVRIVVSSSFDRAVLAEVVRVLEDRRC